MWAASTATTCSRNDVGAILFSLFHALLEQKHAGCSFIFFFSVVGTNTLVDFRFHFFPFLDVSFIIAHFWFLSFLGGILVFLVLLTITNDDIQSMHGGAQHGLRISAFWLLASGSCSRFASVLWFCIAFRISSALFLFAFHACSFSYGACDYHLAYSHHSTHTMLISLQKNMFFYKVQ
jgi:hypothetical protein